MRLILNNVKKAKKSVGFLSTCDFFCKCALTRVFCKNLKNADLYR